MTYILLIIEFFKIGLMAIGGGLATVPFLFDLAQKYGWFTTSELANMIAISESTPGPIGVNMATFAGFNTLGIMGAITATAALTLPALIIMIIIAKFMNKYSCNQRVKNLLSGLRPAVLALILAAGLNIAKIVIIGNTEILLLAGFWAMIRIWKKSPIVNLCIAMVVGVILQL